jgi:urea carboxylase/allophanate hydrolase
MSTSIGWTIPEWKEAQTNSSYEEGRHRLLDLVATFKDYKRGDPAWITLASTELINKQWKELQLMKKDPEVSMRYTKIAFDFILSKIQQ